MERAHREAASGRWLLAYYGSLAVGFFGSTIGWLIHENFAGACKQPTAAPYSELFYASYTTVDVLSLLAAIFTGVLFLQAEGRLGRRHEIGRSLGVLAVLALGAYQFWYLFLTGLAIHPLCW